MNPQPIPNVAKGLLMIRTALDLMPDATPLGIHRALFEADAEHVDRYGRQIYGERWAVDWSGPRGRIIDGILARDQLTLLQLDRPDRSAINEIGHSQDGTTLDLHPALRKIATIRMRRGQAATPTDLLSESDVEALGRACSDPPRDDREALERLLRHPALLRSDGVTVDPRDMLDPLNPDHAERLRALDETCASTFY